MRRARCSGGARGAMGMVGGGVALAARGTTRASELLGDLPHHSPLHPTPPPSPSIEEKKEKKEKSGASRGPCAVVCVCVR